MRRIMLSLALLFTMSLPALAQETRADVFLGYTHTKTYISNGDTSSSNGGDAEIAFYVTRRVGLVADFGGATTGGFDNSSGVHFNVSSHTFHYLFGPRFRFGGERVTPFVQALFGGFTRSDLVNAAGTVTVPAQTSFGLETGGGIDVRVAHHFSIRPIEIAYQYTRFSPPGVQNTQNHIKFSTGIVIH